MALHAAASGITTALTSEDAEGVEDRALVPLWAAFTGAKPLGRGLPISLGLDHSADDSPQLLVSLAIFDDKSEISFPPDTMNLLSISSNSVTADELARLALEAVDAGCALEGVVVVNPDPTDSTSGLIANDTLRLLPTRPRTEGGVDEPVVLTAHTSNALGSSERLSSREG